MKKKGIILFVFVLILSMFLFSQETITIFHAGSLTLPFKIITNNFTKDTGIKVLTVSGGSRGLIRQVTELGKTPDILASADYRLIKEMMFPKYSDTLYEFATNRMVITMSPYSKWLKKINSDNWYKIIEKKDFILAHSDPDIDPCGYRARMVLQLSEKFYNIKGFYTLIKNKIGSKWIRPKSVELLALLETGEIDGAFEYKSVSLQHKLPYVSLPDNVNLGNPKFDKYYSQAKVILKGKKGKELYGKSIVYGITILKKAHNKKGAEKFIKYLLSEKGGKLLIKAYQEPIIPPVKITDNK